MNNPKEYIKDLVYSVKNALYSKEDKDDLDKIIEREHEKAFESLRKYHIIEQIKEKYNINSEKLELEIWENEYPFVEAYSPFENKIIFSKKSIKKEIDDQLEFLSNKEEIIRLINDILEFLGYRKISIRDIQGIEYLCESNNTILLYPSYIDEGNVIESIEKTIIRSAMFHAYWHHFDNMIFQRLIKDPTIKDRYYLFTILSKRDNHELRATAFEVPMYFLLSGLHKDERGYIAAYANIPICRKYIEGINELQNDENKNKYVPYELGFCYGNIIVAKYKSSLEEYIQDIIKHIIYLNKEGAINVINYYGDNPKTLLHD